MSAELPEPTRESPTEEAPHGDYSEEVGSQKRVRWMTQVMVMPALIGWLFGFAYLFGWLAGTRDPERELPRLLVVAIVIATPAYFMLRGRIGARRRWLNLALLALCVGAGSMLGARSHARSYLAEASSTFEPER